MARRILPSGILLVAVGLALFHGCSESCHAAGPPLRSLEQAALQRLAAVQSLPSSSLIPFATDGCSGGMSTAWEHLAELFPTFGDTFGAQPPWEACCVRHDRDYWRGKTVDGYQARLQADEELRRCVIGTGANQARELSDRTGLSPERVTELFSLAAETMYAAVRAGGGPCTGLPWRWGYGWPHCAPPPVLPRGE